MYELHLTEVLLIDIMKLKLFVDGSEESCDCH